MPERLEPGSAEWRHEGLRHLQRYAFATERIAGRRVLDLACGVGYGTYILAQGTGREVTGVDRDAAAVAYGRQHYNRRGLSLEVGDALAWTSPGGEFDTAVSFETIEHLPDPAVFVERLARHLRPGGRLILSAPNALQHQRAAMPVENPFHLHEPDRDTLCRWLEPHFDIEAEWEQSPVLTLEAAGVAPVRTDLESLQRRWWLRAANRVEGLLRRSPRAPERPPAAQPLTLATQIFPLLPERWTECEVFVFVCRRRAHAERS